MPDTASWERDLEQWLEPFLLGLGHKARKAWAPLYLRGLLSRSERKSIQPLAEHLAPHDYDQLHHFVSASHWDAAPLEAVLVQKAQQMLGGEEAFLIIDDTTLLKQGSHSVGVARQYSGAAGKTTNCQALVSLTLAKGEVPLPVALRLFLPQSWTSDPERSLRAGVPQERLRYRKKAEIALEEIDRLRRAGLVFGSVLADAAYGTSADFRGALSARGLRWAVGILRTQKVYDRAVAVSMPPPSTRSPGARGRPRKHPASSCEPRTAEEVLEALPESAWHEVSWRRGTKGPLQARFAALRVRVADGEEDAQGAHLPGEEAWLIGERRTTGERKYFLSNYGPEIALVTLAGAIKARWACEQAHQQMKEELGLDHYEGRKWNGLSHHVLLVMIAFAFLQHQRLKTTAQRGKKEGRRRSRSAAGAEPAGDPAQAADRIDTSRAPALPSLPPPLPI